jgi:hypothetical protein
VVRLHLFPAHIGHGSPIGVFKMQTLTNNENDYLHKVRPEFPADYLKRLEKIRRAITLCLNKCDGFSHVTFTDVSAGHIQIDIHHEDIKSYIFYMVPLAYDFSNQNEAVHAAINAWGKQNLENYKWFLKQGQTWGWD